ncbi:hypothetical protein ACYSJL_10715, partial [Lactobacillus delbrueckii]
GKIHQRFHFSPSEVHARGYIAITSSLIEYLLAKLLSFQGFIVFLMWEVCKHPIAEYIKIPS